MERSLNTLSPALARYFDSAGVRLGDLCSIKPIWGQKSQFKMRHTELLITDSRYSGKRQQTIILPNDEEESFKLILKMSKSNRKRQSSERYFLRSLTERPFWINGNWSFESFLERGDKIKIGHNLLEFGKDKSIDMVKELFVNDLVIDTDLIRSTMTILLEGETGTGKTYWAKKIHEQSGVRGNFVHINLSSYPKELIESELFGHIKGAFTGATNRKEGALNHAHKGTLFLDEIDSLSKDIQTKLLLFLDSGKYRMIGSNKEYKVQTRLIVASGKNLKVLVSKNEMRDDFYYRISSGFTFNLKPIRDRENFIQKFIEVFSIKNKVIVSKDLIDFYQTLPWPGNIRQLEGHLNKKLITSPNKKLYFDDYDQKLIVQSSDLLNLQLENYTLEELQKAYVQKIYHETGKDMSLSSRKLDISKKRLRKILDVA